MYILYIYIYINIIWYVNVRAWVPYAIADLGFSKYATCHVDGRPALTTGKTCNDHFQASWSPRTPLTATVGCGCALASLPECWWEVDQKKKEGSRVSLSLGYLHTRTRLICFFQGTTSDRILIWTWWFNREMPRFNFERCIAQPQTTCSAWYVSGGLDMK